MTWHAPIRAALGTLTIFPAGPVAATALPRALAYFPVVGLGLGGTLVAVAWIGQTLPPLVLAVVLVAVLALLSGGIHLDGWADTWDGLAVRGDLDTTARVMRDPRIGAVGATALGLLLLLKCAALSELVSRPALLLALPVVSRFTVLPVIVFLRPARASGFGFQIHERSRRRDVVAGAILAVGVVTGCGLPIPAVVGVLAGWCFGVGLSWALRGHSGDTYGAVIEMSETAMLVGACA